MKLPLYKNKGVGLIEVMAALFILSVGLLGVAGMQTTGIQAGRTATLRTSAILKSVEIVERMRANPLGVNNAGATFYNAVLADMGIDGSCEDTWGGDAAGCAPDVLARHDIWVWKQSLLQTLGNQAQASIVVTLPPVAAPNTPNIITVTIQWNDRNQNYSNVTEAQIL